MRSSKIFSVWHGIPLFILLFFLAPILIILSSVFADYSENWSHIYEYVLGDYILNSLILVSGVSILVMIIGSLTAWLVTNYQFFGKQFFEWGLILPLAIPPYILAYTFTGLFDSYGTMNEIARSLFNLQQNEMLFPNIRNIYGAIIVFSFTLYPYVYLICRTAFLNQSRSMFEVGRTLGLSQASIFLKLALPLVRPALIAGTMIVAMETLSDFGAVDHFAISTFTTGIFRTWYGMYDLTTAMQLASMLLIFITFCLVIERTSRKNANYSTIGSNFKPTQVTRLGSFGSSVCFFVCFVPIFIGFILPLLEILNWSLRFNTSFFNEQFFSISLNTVLLSILSAILCTFIAMIINFSIRYKNSSVIKSINPFLNIGYAVPGLILAVGIVQLFVFLDNNILNSLEGYFLTGSLFGLIFAYIIKSYALANSTYEAGYQKISQTIDDSARVLKSTGLNLLFRVHFPILKTSFFTSILLVTSEVVKELPATLILRPFNFETLAVSTYIYASEERMVEAAAPATAIILIGLIPIFFISQMIRASRLEKS
ncbi:iron ABC transporter permease [Pseudomonadota bacterium]|nr:iron ABC transporter permease [Pseudomonadota bacterium]